MQAAARYEGGYSGDHPTVRAFWEVMHGLPLDQKRRFLAFATGSDRRALLLQMHVRWPLRFLAPLH